MSCEVPQRATARLISLCKFSLSTCKHLNELTISPGWVHTGLTGAKNGGSKPPGAWTPEQTVDYMVDKVFSEGDFYVICPDNETSTVRIYPKMTGMRLTI